MTHGSHRLVAHRLKGLPERLLTGGVACYRIYATADGRWLTVGALEPKFWQRLCEVVGRPELAERQFDPDQEAVAAELAEAIAARPLAEWLELMDGEDVSRRPGLDDRGGGRRVRRSSPPRRRPRARRAHGRLARRARALDASTGARAESVPSRSEQPGRAASGVARPSRSIRNARIPSAAAPSMSSSTESPTIAASAGATPIRSSAARKIDSCGLVQPCAREAIAQSTSSRVVGDEVRDLAAAVRDEARASARARAARAEHGPDVVVEVEVLRALPRPGSSPPRGRAPRRRRRPCRGRSAR